MKTVTLLTHSAAETRRLGQLIGAALPAGAVLAASGDLGAGKTVFAAGLAAGLGVTEAVTSPTFIFFNEYQGRLPFCHIDAYRLEGLSAEELALVGLEDCFWPEKAVFVEWPQFIAELLPPDCIRLELRRRDDQGGEARCLSFSYDANKEAWLDAIIGD